MSADLLQLRTLEKYVAKRVPPREVDDVVQDVLLRVVQELPTLKDDTRFVPWMYRIARSVVVDHLRKSSRNPEVLADVEHVAEEIEDGGVDLAPFVAALVDQLPTPYREALTLTELTGVKQVEAAKMLGISTSAMKSRVQRGRQKLRDAVEDCCHIRLDARGRVIACASKADGCNC